MVRDHRKIVFSSLGTVVMMTEMKDGIELKLKDPLDLKRAELRKVIRYDYDKRVSAGWSC